MVPLVFVFISLLAFVCGNPYNAALENHYQTARFRNQHFESVSAVHTSKHEERNTPKLQERSTPPLQLRSNEKCYNVCNHLGPQTRSDPLVIYKQQTLLGFYVSTSQSAFVLDQSSEMILIINGQTHESVVFSYLTGDGYYINGFGSIDILTYIQKLNALPGVWRAFKARGTPFRISDDGDIEGSYQPIVFLKKFNILFFGEHQPFSLPKWRNVVFKISKNTDYIYHDSGVFELNSNEYPEFITSLVDGDYGGGYDKPKRKPRIHNRMGHGHSKGSGESGSNESGSSGGSGSSGSGSNESGDSGDSGSNGSGSSGSNESGSGGHRREHRRSSHGGGDVLHSMGREILQLGKRYL